MKVLAFNGSPRGKRSNTDRILQPFLEGARDAGAETETVYLKDLEIKDCLGCFSCCTKTPGVCVQKDGIPSLLEKIRHADITVYATPLYVFTVSGLMKNFMDRIAMPLSDIHIVKRGEHYTHPNRYEDMPRSRIVLVSNCGFPEGHHFSGLVETFHRFTDFPDSELVATILRPMGELLAQPALQDSLNWYYKAVHEAGCEIIELGHITSETQAILDRDLMPVETYVMMANAYWDSQIVTPPAIEESKPGRPLQTLTDEPTTLQELITGMPSAFNAQSAGDLQAVIQFDVSGEEPGQYYLRIAKGKCAAFEGKHPHPMLTIHTPSEVWIAIIRGELNGTQAMMQRKYTVEGNLSLLIRFNDLFSAAPKA